MKIREHELKSSRFHPWFANQPLRIKVLLTITAVSFAVVVLSLATSLFFEVAHFRQRLKNQYEVSIGLMASNLEAAAAFQDSYDSVEILNALKDYSSIKKAVVILENGNLLAEFVGEGFDQPIELHQETLNSFSGSNIYINKPIRVRDEVLGHLVVYGELSEYQRYLWVKFLTFFLTIFIALTIALLLAVKTEKLLTQPILDLTETAKKITSIQDFSIRQKKTTNDEVGHLIESFNQMIEQIENQNDVIWANAVRFKSYFDLGIVGMAILDENMGITESNSRMREILGEKGDTLIGKKWYEFYSENDQLDRIDSEGSNIREETWLQTNQGTLVYVMTSLREIPETKTTKKQYILLVQDITERKLNEDELIKAKEKAEASNKAKNEFLSVMSHELRTPLNPIIGFTELLKSEEQSPQSTNFLNKIHHSADHLLAIIDSILDYTRIEKGIVDLKSESVDYVQLCQNTVELIEKESYAKNIRFKQSHSIGEGFSTNEYPDLLTDKSKIGQVILNLLSNAAKFTAEGTVSVDTVISKKTTHVAELKVCITDTGMGISPEKVEHIFEPFTQADSSLSRKYGGIGLGLSVCKKIITLLGGNIYCESELKVGSRFWFTIPVSIASKPEHISPKPIRSKSNRKNLKNILIVEDDPMNQEVILAMINDLGYQADIATDGKSGTQMANSKDYDVILMDIQMPDIDGFEVTRMILAENESAPAIIGISAHAGIDKEEFIKHGMLDFLAKPFGVNELRTVIERASETATE